MDYLHQLLFGLFPYIAGSVFLLGSLLRYDRGQYTWRAMSSQMLSGGQAFRWGSNLFHLGIILLYFGHLFGLLTPKELYHAFGLSTAAKQAMAIWLGGLFGTICFFGLSYLLYRRLFNERVRANSASMDTAIIALIYLQLITGLSTIFVSVEHSDGAVMVHLAHWAQHVVTFRSDAWSYIVDVPMIYKIHVFLGLVMFTLFPFSRLVHIWSWPIEYVQRRYQVVRHH
ncbi:MAG: respiratory nitrate reductase subunit gamma [Gammaproteobacteria bacterium]|nr:respiratory nitrate reductase subunit gamma [Gammaproteobacteria bacterium]